MGHLGRYTLVLPSSLIALIAIIAFFSPATNAGVRQEKCRLGLSAFISMLVLQLNNIQKLPKSGNVVPLLGTLLPSYSFFQGRFQLGIKNQAGRES